MQLNGKTGSPLRLGSAAPPLASDSPRPAYGSPSSSTCVTCSHHFCSTSTPSFSKLAIWAWLRRAAATPHTRHSKLATARTSQPCSGCTGSVACCTHEPLGTWKTRMSVSLTTRRLSAESSNRGPCSSSTSKSADGGSRMRIVDAASTESMCLSFSVLPEMSADTRRCIQRSSVQMVADTIENVVVQRAQRWDSRRSLPHEPAQRGLVARPRERLASH